MPEIKPTRRAVIRTAAWSVPAVTVAAAAPAFAGSGPGATPTYQDVTKTFIYTALGGAVDISVAVTARNVPLTAPVGATLLPIETTSVVTIPATLAPTLRSLFLGNAAKVGGTSVSVSELTGALTLNSTTNLTIPIEPFPAAADPLITTASGTGNPLTVPGGAIPGLVTITMGQPNSTLVGYNNDDTPNGSTYNSVLAYKTAKTDYVLATFNVVSA